MLMSGLYAKASSQLQMLRLAQIVIQLRKFAEAVKRIKGAVSPADKAASSAPKGGRPAGSGGGGGRAFPPGGSGVLDRDMSSTLRTEMSVIDPSPGGARARLRRRSLSDVAERTAGAPLQVAFALPVVMFLADLKVASTPAAHYASGGRS